MEVDETWKEVATDRDIADLMSEVCGFHDCCVSGIRCWANTYVDESGAMINAASQRLWTCIVFQQQVVPPRVYELLCEDVADLHLSAPSREYSAALMEATLLRRAEMKYWSADPDWTPELGGTDMSNTWLACRRMWWRRADDMRGEVSYLSR